MTTGWSGLQRRGVRALAVGAVALSALAFTACEDVTGVPGFQVTAKTVEAVGDTVTLATVGNRSGVTWTSLDPTILQVSAAGVAIARRAGTARVQARDRSRIATGTVTVLPAADIQVWQAGLAADGPGQQKLTLRLRNLGGRGFYRLEVYRHGPNGARLPVLIDNSDISALPGMDIQYSTWLQVPAGATHAGDWVVVRSREGSAGQLRATSCALLHGQGQCIIP